jgi:hydroxymethylglutaryl-CoA reductase
MIAPIVVGTVGGVTNLHPVAKVCMKLLGQPTSQRLSQIAGAVGLVQNLGALRALTTVGIIEGHMRLHIKNLSLGAGAKDSEMPAMIQRLEDFLKINKRVTLTNAVQVLQELRATQ